MRLSRLFEMPATRRGLAVAVVVLGAGLLLAGAPAQETPPGAASQPLVEPKLHAAEAVDCTVCHACEKPTAEEPCLRPCARPREAEMIAELRRGNVPQGVVLLDMLSTSSDTADHFGPVPFDHAGHAKWAEIAGGCELCHHYTPAGAAHPSCSSCHEASYRHEDMRKPGLKGAYHRQCLGCHREWSHETKCDVCHLPRVGDDGQPVTASAASKDDVMGKIHPPIPEPKQEIYQTKYKSHPGTNVIFRHKEHIERYGLKCAECHRGDSCMRCHEEGKQHTQHVRTLEEHHRPCSDCHNTNDEANCTRCHWDAAKGPPAPFDHASTGWPLSRFHQKNTCRACHKGTRFEKLDPTCTSCHEGWSPATFDHKVTGQVLDENHAEFDCEECHLGNKFDVPPSCTECHDEDEGPSFPAKRPGPLVSDTSAAAKPSGAGTE